jgi:hypothetical protein
MSSSIDITNLFNSIFENNAYVTEAPSETPTIQESFIPQVPVDTFQTATAAAPRFDSRSDNDESGFIDFNPLSVDFGGRGDDDVPQIGSPEFNNELEGILGRLSQGNLTPDQQIEIGDDLDTLLTNQEIPENIDQPQGNNNGGNAGVHRLTDGISNLQNQIDGLRNQQIANAPLKETAQRINDTFGNSDLAGLARALQGQAQAIKPDGSTLGAFADLVARRRQAKLEQEALERRLSTQIDRLMGAVKVKDSIKLASSQS